MPNYGDASFWDDRYSKQTTTFDWLESWADLKDTIEQFAMTGIYPEEVQSSSAS